MRNCARPLPKLQSASVLLTMETITSLGSMPQLDFELTAEFCVERLLHLFGARAAGDGDDDNVVGALNVETGVLHDEVIRRMLGVDLIAVALGNLEGREHGAMRGVEKVLDLFGLRPAMASMRIRGMKNSSRVPRSYRECHEGCLEGADVSGAVRSPIILSSRGEL